jgi:hypothetical protein
MFHEGGIGRTLKDPEYTDDTSGQQIIEYDRVGQRIVKLNSGNPSARLIY